MRSLAVGNVSALLVNLLAFTCGCSSYSPGRPCRQQRRRRSGEAAWSSARLSSSSGTTGSLRLSQEAAVRHQQPTDGGQNDSSGSAHLEPAPSRCRWAGAACTHRSASRCWGGRTASGSYRHTNTPQGLLASSGLGHMTGVMIADTEPSPRSPRFRQEADFQLRRQIFFAGFDCNWRSVPLQRSFKHLPKVTLATSRQRSNAGDGGRKKGHC